MKRSMFGLLPMPSAAWLVFVIGSFMVVAAIAEDLKSNQSKAVDATKKSTPLSAKAALEEFNSLIGEWRGVGQTKRGSSKGAWTEQAEWVWDFRDGRTAIRYEVDDGKLLDVASLTWDAESERFHLAATLPDESKRLLSGKLIDGQLVLESQPDDDDWVHRLTVTRLNAKRTLVLFEKRRSSAKTFSRVAEVGYTRQGTSLAVEGSNGPECVVTGGTGTMKVSYQGETYYVCCTGCRQAFDDDPEGILAEYRQRLAERKKP